MSNIPDPAARLLARLMSDLSEEYFCAGWLMDCEYALWADLTDQEIAGITRWKISQDEREELRVAHEAAGGWIVWSRENGGETFLSNADWLAHLAAKKGLTQGL